MQCLLILGQNNTALGNVENVFKVVELVRLG